MMVQTFNEKMTESFTAGEALAATAAGLLLKADASTGVVAVNTTAKGDCVGVLDEQGAVASGGLACVVVSGRVDVQAGGTIVKGGLVASNNAGKAVAFADGYAVGRALTAGASGGVVKVQLFTVQKDA